MKEVYGRETCMKKLLKRIFKNKLFYILLVVVITTVVINRNLAQKRKHSSLVTFKTKRQNLVISVVEGGNLVALESQQIRNEVPGSRTILEVVDEGTRITEEDIANGRILIKLDSQDLEDRREQLILNVENSLAAYTQEEQQFEIQKKQNESNITQAKLKVKFAEMDLTKYLGDQLVESVIGKSEKINFAVLIRSDNLGGEALNKKSSLENKIDLAKEEVARAKDKVTWSEKLAEKGYVTKIELEADKLALKQKELAQQQAELEYQLFLKYDFAKAVEQYLSDYEEAKLELERVIDTAKAKMVQAEANLKNKKATYLLTRANLRNVERDIERCTIRATKQGFVTYATSGRPWASQNPIQPGTTVRQYQNLLELPDFRTLGVEIKVHESAIKRISPGLSANIIVDAFPDVPLTGTVKKIAIMPDATIKFLNPDINVYLTQITLNNIDKSMSFLKPGMTAKAEILVKELKNVIAVPINAVFFRGTKSYVSVLKDGVLLEKEVELGDSNSTMVEIKKGLVEGETVVIKPGIAITSSVKKSEMEEKGTFKDTTSRENVATQGDSQTESLPDAGQPAQRQAVPVGSEGKTPVRSGRIGNEKNKMPAQNN